MTIASALTDLNTDIQNARTAITNKGGTVTVDGGSSQLATDIGTITELKGETRSVNLTNSSGSTYTPSVGKNGITSITVTPRNQPITVTPTTSTQTITVSQRYSGNGTITVNPVTSAIDPNIQAGNIKQGVSILSVTGTYSGEPSSKYGLTIDDIIGDTNSSGVLQPPEYRTINMVFDGVTDIASYGLVYAFSYKSNIRANVSFPDLTQISGTDGLFCTFTNVNVTSISFPELVTINAQEACYRTFNSCPHLSNISLPKLTTISGQRACYQMFGGLPELTSISLPALTTISGNYVCYQMFYICLSLTSVSLPLLATINGDNGCQYMFYNCTALETISFPELVSITGSSCFSYMFSQCSKLASIFFPKLTTSSFGNNVNQFSSMFNSNTGTQSTSGTCTLHFPSNIESTIQGLTGYPLFGGTSGRIVLAFDLPATS